MKSILERIVSPIDSLDDTLGGLHPFDVWKQCDTDVTDACVPRPPKPEWFGDEKGQWMRWWWDGVGVIEFVSMDDDMITFRTEAGDLSEMWIGLGSDCPDRCVPVVSEGYPAPVGWHVVGG